MAHFLWENGVPHSEGTQNSNIYIYFVAGKKTYYSILLPSHFLFLKVTLAGMPNTLEENRRSDGKMLAAMNGRTY